MKIIGKQLIQFVLWTSFLYIGYQLTNRYQFFDLHLMPKILGEENIPFLVWTVLPYLLLINLMYLPIFIKKENYFKKSIIALTTAVLINYLIFIVFPTYMIRHTPPTSEGFFNKLYLWLLSIDGPANCFPSGHITSPGIGCWYFAKAYPKSRYVLLFLFVFLCSTVITTKQHYVLDIFGGIFTGLIGIYTAHFFTNNKTAKHLKPTSQTENFDLLIDLLQQAYSGELAAAYAYRSHWKSVKNPEEKSCIRKIEEDEWHHRKQVGEILKKFGKKPSRFKEIKFWCIGKAAGALCFVTGWFAPMYGAGKLEYINVREYETAAQFANNSGHTELIECLLTMAEVEWVHENYFRSQVLKHFLSKYIPLWPINKPKESIRSDFHKFNSAPK